LTGGVETTGVATRAAIHSAGAGGRAGTEPKPAPEGTVEPEGTTDPEGTAAPEAPAELGGTAECEESTGAGGRATVCPITAGTKAVHTTDPISKILLLFWTPFLSCPQKPSSNRKAFGVWF